MKKALLALPALATLALAGCATDGATDGSNNQYARADCKIYPITTMSYTGVRDPKVDSLDQRAAEGDLAGSKYRFRTVARSGNVNNNLEDIIRDCGR